jgi:hypothetical protein
MNTRFPIQETSQQTILYYVLFFVLLFLFQNCSTEVQFDKIDPPTPINKSLSSILIKDCSFNGSVISHESRVNAFLESAVPYGQLCSSQERVCNNGTLSGSFAYASCSSGSPQACLFDGKTIPHGGKIKAYLTSAVPYGQLCSSQEQERVCNNGTLSGSFAYASCSSGSPQACLFDGQTIPHGGKINAYLTSAVPYGQLCSSQERVCNNGTLSGSFAYASCSSGSPQACLFDGKTIPHGGKINAYLTSAVPYGQLCSSQRKSVFATTERFLDLLRMRPVLQVHRRHVFLMAKRYLMEARSMLILRQQFLTDSSALHKSVFATTERFLDLLRMRPVTNPLQIPQAVGLLT